MRRLLLSSFELPLLDSNIFNALGLFLRSYLLESFLFGEIERSVGIGAVSGDGIRCIGDGVGSRHLVNCVRGWLEAFGCVIMWLDEVEFGKACEQRCVKL